MLACAASNFTLVAVYIVVSTAVESVPVAVVIVTGERADENFARGRSWLVEHGDALRTWLSLGIGGALVVDALLRLFA